MPPAVGALRPQTPDRQGAGADGGFAAFTPPRKE